MATASASRRDLTTLIGLAGRELEKFFALAANWSAEETRDALMELLPALGDQYGDAAVALAADYYEEARELAGVSGSFTPVLPEPTEPARWEALARWGVDPLFLSTPVAAETLQRITGGLSRTIADQHRLTIVESSVRDPKAAGWTRVTRADSCGFCRMLSGRGGVYTESSVEFKSHDHCNCAAAPSWDTNAKKVIGVPFEYSQRKSNWSPERKARENQKVYEYMREHGLEP